MFLDRAPGMAMVVVPSLVPSVSLRFPPLVGVFLRRLCACYILFVRCCCCSPSHFLTTILGGERCWRFSSSVCCYFRYAFIAIVFTAATSVCYRFFYLLQRRHHTSADSGRMTWKFVSPAPSESPAASAPLHIPSSGLPFVCFCCM